MFKRFYLRIWNLEKETRTFSRLEKTACVSGASRGRGRINAGLGGEETGLEKRGRNQRDDAGTGRDTGREMGRWGDGEIEGDRERRFVECYLYYPAVEGFAGRGVWRRWRLSGAVSGRREKQRVKRREGWKERHRGRRLSRDTFVSTHVCSPNLMWRLRHVPLLPLLLSLPSFFAVARPTPMIAREYRSNVVWKELDQIIFLPAFGNRIKNFRPEFW